jgi:hypothetical protein
VYLLLASRRRHPRGLYAIPIVFAAWANLHGAFLLGLILIGAHAADEVLIALTAHLRGQPTSWHHSLRLIVVLGLAVLATLLSPIGTGVYGYVWGTASLSNVGLVGEWQATSIQTFAGRALAASSRGPAT